MLFRNDIRELGVDGLCANLFQLITDCTRVVSATLLDHIYTNIHNATVSVTLDYFISDLAPILHAIDMC